MNTVTFPSFPASPLSFSFSFLLARKKVPVYMLAGRGRGECNGSYWGGVINPEMSKGHITNSDKHQNREMYQPSKIRV